MHELKEQPLDVALCQDRLARASGPRTARRAPCVRGMRLLLPRMRALCAFFSPEERHSPRSVCALLVCGVAVLSSLEEEVKKEVEEKLSRRGL